MYLFKKDPFAEQMLQVINDEFKSQKEKEQRRKKPEKAPKELVEIFGRQFKGVLQQRVRTKTIEIQSL